MNESNSNSFALLGEKQDYEAPIFRHFGGDSRYQK
jgi:hypothetical protein